MFVGEGGGIYLSLAVTTRCVLRTQSECSQVVLASLQLSWGSADLLSQRDWGTVSGVQCGDQSGAQSGACKIIIIKLDISHQFFLQIIYIKIHFFPWASVTYDQSFLCQKVFINFFPLLG